MTVRIQFLASTLTRGGAETMAVALSRRLRQRGHDVRWTLLRDAGELGGTLGGAVPVETDVAPSRFCPMGVVRLARRLRGADALYALDHQNAVVQAALAAPVAGVKRRVVAVHTTGLWGGRPSLGRPFRWALRSYYAVLALSRAHAAYLSREEGVPPDRIRIVPNGIDPARFAALPTRQDARTWLGIPPEGPVVGSVAMLRPEKNLGALLDAAAVVRRRFEELTVVLVGDGPERETLEKRAKESDLQGAVRFLGLRNDVPRILPAFDLFVLPSLPEVETQPVAVLEAMAVGVPVVATRVGDLPELLEGGRAGVLVEPGDTEGLAHALQALLDDPRRGKALAEAARKVAGRHTLDASTDALLAVLEEGRR